MWKPIETAPKDGDWILVYYDNVMGVSIASWSGGMWLDWDGDLYGPPTHWQPLPEPPKE